MRNAREMPPAPDGHRTIRTRIKDLGDVLGSKVSKIKRRGLAITSAAAVGLASLGGCGGSLPANNTIARGCTVTTYVGIGEHAVVGLLIENCAPGSAELVDHEGSFQLEERVKGNLAWTPVGTSEPITGPPATPGGTREFDTNVTGCEPGDRYRVSGNIHGSAVDGGEMSTFRSIALWAPPDFIDGVLATDALCTGPFERR